MSGRPSVGASGAIFGLAGASLGFAFAMRRQIPARVYQRWLYGLGPVILLNLLIGFSVAQIDNNAHIGGLVAGMLLGASLASGVETPGRRSLRQRALFVLVMVALFVLIGYALWNPALPVVPVTMVPGGR